jgi:NADH dehydrogenase
MPTFCWLQEPSHCRGCPETRCCHGLKQETDVDHLHKERTRIVIIGGGFGGLACAQQLGNSEMEVIVIDRRNHNLFQPLLYQVATAALSPADIAEPIRRTLGRYHNISMMMAEVVAVDKDAQSVRLQDGSSVSYDKLVIATGSEYNYFGHDEWQGHAPGLKTIHEARKIRHKLLLSFEKAERTSDVQERRELLTTVVIGGGPTGVEMAGAISELGRFMIERDFRNLNRNDLRVILVEAGPRILAAFPEHLSLYATTYLKRAGVEILTQSRVQNIEEGGVAIGSEWVEAGCIIWGAGVKASPAASWLGLQGTAGGKIPTDQHLKVVGFDDIYALGDTSFLLGKDGKPLPGLAQVAKQQGIYLGKYLRRGAPPDAPAFEYHNRGNAAVIGRHAAVFDFGRWTLKGPLAWYLWAIVHVYLLINLEKRVLVSIQWIWRYLTKGRGARLIDETTNSTLNGPYSSKQHIGRAPHPVGAISNLQNPPI